MTRATPPEALASGLSRDKPKDAPGALRERICDYVIRRITSGEWPVGARVPSESEFTTLFGVSRMTVHHALRDLTARGFLTRRKGDGSFVAAPRPYASVYEHLDIVADIAGRGGRHSGEVIRRELRKATPAEAREFDIGAPGLLFHAIVLHREDDRPVELEDRLLNPIAMPDCMEVDLTRQSLFSRLLLVRPYREGSESLRPVMPSRAARQLLGLRAGEPCLEINRKTWSSDGVVTVARILRAGAAGALHGAIVARPGAA